MGLDMFRGRGVPMGRALYLGNCWRIDMAMFIVGVVVGTGGDRIRGVHRCVWGERGNY
jgi:hypothetical protein